MDQLSRGEMWDTDGCRAQKEKVLCSPSDAAATGHSEKQVQTEVQTADHPVPAAHST